MVKARSVVLEWQLCKRRMLGSGKRCAEEQSELFSSPRSHSLSQGCAAQQGTRRMNGDITEKKLFGLKQ